MCLWRGGGGGRDAVSKCVFGGRDVMQSVNVSLKGGEGNVAVCNCVCVCVCVWGEGA